MTYTDLIIEFSPLKLCTFHATDADEIYRHITPTLTRYMSWNPPANPIEFKQIWQQWIKDIETKKELVLIIRHDTLNEFLGVAALHQLQSKTPELGIWIREDRHGSRYGRTAIYALADWASKHLDIEHFIYPVAVDNLASRAIAEALGGTIYQQEKKPKYQSITYAIPALTHNLH